MSKSKKKEIIEDAMSKSRNADHKQRAPINVSEAIKKPYLNEFEVSAITGRSIHTLRNERFLRKGLNYYKISGRTIRYKTEDVIRFMEKIFVSFDNEIQKK